MNILGVSAFYHDSSATLIQNGVVKASAAEERFSLQKHDSHFPKFAIQFCLEQAGIEIGDVDGIFFYENTHQKFTRVLISSLTQYPRNAALFSRSMKSWLTTKLWTKETISKKLGYNAKFITELSHHKSHAAQSFFASPFETAGILIIDSVGEWSSTSLFTASARNKEALIEHDTLDFPHSLGFVYSAFTAFLGFRVNDGECSTMALAAFGKPIYADEVRKIIQVSSDGLYKVDTSYFDLFAYEGKPLTKKFYKVFGEARLTKNPLRWDCLEISQSLSEDEIRFANVAASIQLVFEEAVLALANRLYKISGSENICLGGGGALNCVSNSKILEKTKFKNIFIAPDPGDGGGSMGAAYLGAAILDKNQTLFPLENPYLGKTYSETSEMLMLDHINPDHWIRHREIGPTQKSGLKLKRLQHQSFDTLVPEVVQRLKSGQIIGWFQGSFENGPRALGNRSILIRPDDLDLTRKLSRDVKIRASYRPYALSTTPDLAKKFLVNPDPQLSRWMQTSAQVTPEMRSKVQGGIHIDGSTRPQICSETENVKYFALINAFFKATDIPALLNTSFNEGGFPLVSSPTEALLVFARTEMDALVINNTIIWKE